MKLEHIVKAQNTTCFKTNYYILYNISYRETPKVLI